MAGAPVTVRVVVLARKNLVEDRFQIAFGTRARLHESQAHRSHLPFSFIRSAAADSNSGDRASYKRAKRALVAA